MGSVSKSPAYFTVISWNIWVLLIPVIIYIIWRAVIDRRDKNSVAMFSACWFVGVYITLIALELIIGRPMYTFYFYPAIPAACLGIASIGWKLGQSTRTNAKTWFVFLVFLSLYVTVSLYIFIRILPFGF